MGTPVTITLPLPPGRDAVWLETFTATVQEFAAMLDLPAVTVAFMAPLVLAEMAPGTSAVPSLAIRA